MTVTVGYRLNPDRRRLYRKPEQAEAPLPALGVSDLDPNPLPLLLRQGYFLPPLQIASKHFENHQNSEIQSPIFFLVKSTNFPPLTLPLKA